MLSSISLPLLRVEFLAAESEQSDKWISGRYLAGVSIGAQFVRPDATQSWICAA